MRLATRSFPLRRLLPLLAAASLPLVGCSGEAPVAPDVELAQAQSPLAFTLTPKVERYGIRAKNAGCADIGAPNGKWTGGPVFSGEDLFCSYRFVQTPGTRVTPIAVALDALEQAATTTGSPTAVDRSPYVRADIRPLSAPPVEARLRRVFTSVGNLTRRTAPSTPTPTTPPAGTSFVSTGAPPSGGGIGAASGPSDIQNPGGFPRRVHGCDACVGYSPALAAIIGFVPYNEIASDLWININGIYYALEGVTSQAFYVTAPFPIEDDMTLLIHWERPEGL
jgi:hypothetical protein